MESRQHVSVTDSMCLLRPSKCVKCVFACGNLFLNCDFVDRDLDCVYFFLHFSCFGRAYWSEVSLSLLIGLLILTQVDRLNIVSLNSKFQSCHCRTCDQKTTRTSCAICFVILVIVSLAVHLLRMKYRQNMLPLISLMKFVNIYQFIRISSHG